MAGGQGEQGMPRNRREGKDSEAVTRLAQPQCLGSPCDGWERRLEALGPGWLWALNAMLNFVEKMQIFK